MSDITKVIKRSKKNMRLQDTVKEVIGFNLNELKSIILSVVLSDGTIKVSEFSLANSDVYLSKKKQLVFDIDGNSKVVTKTFTKDDLERIKIKNAGFATDKDGIVNLTPNKKNKKNKKKSRVVK